MNNDPYSTMYGGDPMAMLSGGIAPQQQSQSLWELLDDRLRGRWTYMFVIGALLAGILAFVGWRTDQPAYKSEGVIRVKDAVITVYGEFAEHPSMRPESERATQALLVRSRRVLELALKDEKLRAHEFGRNPNALGMIEDNIIVEPDRSSELIFVMYESESPELAQLIVNAVVRAYYEIFGRVGSEQMSENMQRLMDREQDLNRQITAKNNELQARLAKYETSDLRSWQERKLERIEEIDMLMLTAQTLLNRAEGNDDDAFAESALVPTDAVLERMSPRLYQLGAMRETRSAEFDSVRSKFKPGTYQYKDAEREYNAAVDSYNKERLIVLELWESNGGLEGVAGSAESSKLAQMSPAQLQEEIDNYAAQLAALREETKQAIEDIQHVESLGSELKQLQDELASVRGRISNLELNEPRLKDGRIEIAQEATYPLEVSSDGRRKRAMLGAVAGFGVSFAAFFLLGTIDRRAFATQQLKTGMGGKLPPCLGVLPDLSRSSDDPEANDVAAHCVHQIRNQIEAQRPAEQGYVLAVSSPCQGDGKTSIVLSLGWSYAAAGYRTLMIDCDLVGRSLTRQLGMVGRAGLREALVSKSVNGEVVPLSMPCLSALPVGFNASFGPERIRRHGLDVLFEQVRPHFDIIIVDTGPILGSLESTPVVAAANGVILSVRRGRSRSKLDEAVTRLESLRGRCLGVVLNWAVRADCYRYVSETSLPSAEAEQPPDDGEQVTITAPSSGKSNALILAMEQASPPQRPGTGTEHTS